ncbi:uncharacterized protein C24B11.05 isoform X1 [Dioscorea cayenensis subsp. rotundata]|uniref:Uncharacterized protein C24B11.05 isoform X1 n=2 Tax=Dioscorea cayennensis subsp. rotundata TaxID=55577 RepID=A0AB40ATX7_DIOCR|nr:uncharacterized protein C24B11.05 isoform X1 [Dioscorea cayenensis subsp. rotundata]
MDSVASESKYGCLLFDMDDTLYPLSVGLNLECRKNIQDYMLHHLHIEENQVPKMCLDLYKEYGTTMAGLKVLGYEFDNDEFHAYVHGKLPYENLKPDLVLRNLLLSMPQRKIIFTNADREHAAKVLNKLGLEDCFEGVICFETLNPSVVPGNTDEQIDSTDSNAQEYSNGKSPIICKPSLEAMQAAIKIANIDPKKTIFFDDSARNIASGKEAGLNTVYVGSSTLVPGADIALSSIHNIKEALPEIWEGQDQSDALLTSTRMETVVHA